MAALPASKDLTTKSTFRVFAVPGEKTVANSGMMRAQFNLSRAAANGLCRWLPE
ncbi:hypothetical protein THIX_60216 [Thiomonas sp. X19]|nr:hypothetical protein THIX_60216 [Thiomonas sp. X19]